MACGCGSGEAVKNGRMKDGRQRWLCRGCGRRWADDRQRGRVDPVLLGVVMRMLGHRFGVPAIEKATGLPKRTIYYYRDKGLKQQ